VVLGGVDEKQKKDGGEQSTSHKPACRSWASVKARE